ncbi:MAG: serine hydrolase domain-containing protein [Actinomycetota bacterium]
MADLTVHGEISPGWESVHDAFVANFEHGLELGASVHVTHDGKPVVDLWAGDAGPDGRPWHQDTIVNVYSTTKTMTAISLMMLVDRGLVDPAAPVATYWPEFAANGKASITVGQIMAHTSGLAGFEPAITVETLYDWDRCCDILAAMAPWWEPGTASGYHAITHGNLMGEVVRRVDGRSVGTFFREEVAGPLGADFHIGFGPELDDRCGDLVPPDIGLAADVEANDMPLRTLRSVPLTGHEPATREWRAAEIPAAGGFGNAASVGRVHAAIACGGTLDGVTLMAPETVARIAEQQHEGIDLVFGGDAPIRYGLGFGLPSEMIPLPNPNSFFWGGWGGSLAIIDPDAKFTISYVMNQMAPQLMGDTRGGGIAMAAYLALMTQV